jgi:hypothetical protein
MTAQMSMARIFAKIKKLFWILFQIKELRPKSLPFNVFPMQWLTFNEEDRWVPETKSNL